MREEAIQIPMFIHFSWHSSEGTAHLNAWQGRRLLNLEKVMFSTDKHGMPPGLLLLTVSREGVHVNGPKAGPKKLLYNIGVFKLVHATQTVGA